MRIRELDITQKVAEHVKKTGISLTAISKKTGIPYYLLFESLSEQGRGRELRADELVCVCRILKINPMELANPPTKKA